MAGTRVPGEGETPTEMEQEMSLGQLQERNPNLLWKLGSPAGWGRLMKHPSLQTPGSIKQPSGAGMGAMGTGERAEHSNEGGRCHSGPPHCWDVPMHRRENVKGTTGNQGNT